MNNILCLFAHPALHVSRVHARWKKVAQECEHVTLHDLYARYPDEFIDVLHEQDLLRKHDVILMQFPLYWFSSPAIIKHWQDVVLEYGFAFGEGERALKDKVFGVVTSTGGRDYIYQRGQGYRFAVRDYLLPIESMAKICEMRYIPPFVIHDSHRIDDDAFNLHTRNYRFYLDSLAQVEQYYDNWRDAVNVNSKLFEQKGASDE
ncbi:NAD(P)H-dependent oxidoreductase [Suttonella sp. R2A3]|uniref:NAD(P)H-dependent oxidoreductase n=1 Tax=Suttonella sp. R2A3 TaxID=2908648 RepID=UPI001F22654F|nr:NAD(P)H-dependent oxidoreductase [Suttonella sp. R2A3]UJF24465.1 NAD(P)H-dependent oxidoreductase [Suttonella sp. R2A3]